MENLPEWKSTSDSSSKSWTKFFSVIRYTDHQLLFSHTPKNQLHKTSTPHPFPSPPMIISRVSNFNSRSSWSHPSSDEGKLCLPDKLHNIPDLRHGDPTFNPFRILVSEHRPVSLPCISLSSGRILGTSQSPEEKGVLQTEFQRIRRNSRLLLRWKLKAK